MDLRLLAEPQEPQLWTHLQEGELSQQDALQAPFPSLPAVVSVPEPSKAGRGLQTPNVPAPNPGKGTASAQGSPSTCSAAQSLQRSQGSPASPHCGQVTRVPHSFAQMIDPCGSCPRRGPGARHIPPVPKNVPVIPRGPHQVRTPACS